MYAIQIVCNSLTDTVVMHHEMRELFTRLAYHCPQLMNKHGVVDATLIESSIKTVAHTPSRVIIMQFSYEDREENIYDVTLPVASVRQAALWLCETFKQQPIGLD